MHRNIKLIYIFFSKILFNHFYFQDLLQTHRSAYNRLGKVQSSGNVLTHKQGNNSINSFNFFEKK